MSAKPTPIEVFLSYTSEDESLRLELEKHLSVLKQEGLITIWHKGRMGVGKDRDKELDEHLSTASVIVLLLSAGFAASEACVGVEVRRAMQRQEAGEAYVLLVLLRPMDDWRNMPFGRLAALPSNGVPVTEWSDTHAAFADVAQGIRSVVKEGKLPEGVEPPAPLSSICNIPYPRNPFFTGRDELLDRLSTALRTGQATALSQPQAITGLGGVGKTQVAVEFAYRYGSKYKAVFWVLADTRESLVSGLVAIASWLNLPEKDSEAQQIVIEAVKTWLRTQHSWLLVLDNADDPGIVGEFVPPTFGGHLLLTTRAQAMGGRASRIEVDMMDLSTGALFLLRRVGLVEELASLNRASSVDEAIAREITEELGGLPLALDQAGAYIEETQCSLLDYQQRYRTRRRYLLQRRGKTAPGHPDSVATTWSLSFEKVEQKDPRAAEVLRLCAFLHPDAVPVDLIIQGAEHLGPSIASVAEDDVGLDEAIATLGTYSLIHRNGETNMLSLHRLVQAVIRDAMDGQMRHLWTERVVQALDKMFPSVSFMAWPQCEHYLPHALLCADWIEQEQISSLEAARLLYNAGCYLIERGRELEAYPLLQQAFVINEQHLAPPHTDRASAGDRLAQCIGTQGKYKDVELLFMGMLSIHEKEYGSDHPEVATDLNNLANLYKIWKEYVKAASLFQEALTIREQTLGKTHLDTAQSMWCLAFTSVYLKQYDSAELLYNRTLSIYRDALRKAHPDTQRVQGEYVSLLRTMGRYEEADSLEMLGQEEES